MIDSLIMVFTTVYNIATHLFDSYFGVTFVHHQHHQRGQLHPDREFWACSSWGPSTTATRTDICDVSHPPSTECGYYEPLCKKGNDDFLPYWLLLLLFMILHIILVLDIHLFSTVTSYASAPDEVAQFSKRVEIFKEIHTRYVLNT